MPSEGAFEFGRFRLFVRKRLLEDDQGPVRVGDRAFDILSLLLSRAGEVVDRREIIAEVWRDVVVDDGSLRFNLSSLRKAIGDGKDGARYIATVAGRGYSFVAPVRRLEDGTEAEPSSAPAALPPAGLPTRLSRMIGRDALVEEAASALLRDRFLTLTGPGGIGKTTVAICVAHHLVDEFRGQVVFVDLGAVINPALVPSAVASATGFVAHTPDIAPKLIEFLASRRLLLVLDNCEHVIDEAAHLAEGIFAGAGETWLLATSREELRAEGEHVFQVPPLSSPPGHSDLGASEALAFSAVELFTERISASGTPFELTDAETPAVAEICRSLDGIPLAIELAAACVKAYGLQGMSSLLGDRFGELAAGRRTANPRHQTLKAMLDWSYDLLSESEALMLRRLSLFVGSFSLEAARAVIALDDRDDTRVLEAIRSLVLKSLISTEMPHGALGYRLLDTTRAYLRSKLLASGEADEVARRHALYFLGLLEAGEVKADTPDLSSLLGNVRAALEWSFGTGGDTEVATALSAAAAPLLVELSLLTECCRWAQRGIDALTPAGRGTVREINLQAAFGHCLMFTEGNSERVRLAFTRGVELARSLGEPIMELRLLGSLHLFNERIGNYHGAIEFAARSAELAGELGNPSAIAAAGSFQGLSQHLIGNHAAAGELLRAALAQNVPRGDARAIDFGFDYRNRTRITLARHLWLTGQPECARDVALQTIEDASRLHHPVTYCIALIWGITVFLWLGDEQRSSDAIQSFRAHALKHSLNPYNAVGLGYEGELSVLKGDSRSGVPMLRQALQELRAARYALVSTTFMISLARGLEAVGDVDGARACIDEAFALVKSNGDLLYMPEVLRVRAAIFAASDGARAEQLLRESIALARQQGALGWELRSTVDLAQLLRCDGRGASVREALEELRSRFNGPDSGADIRAADAVLRALRGEVGATR